VKSNVEYIIANNIPNSPTDEESFKQAYVPQYYYDIQYNQYISVQFPQQPQHVEEEQVAVATEQPIQEEPVSTQAVAETEVIKATE